MNQTHWLDEHIDLYLEGPALEAARKVLADPGVREAPGSSHNHQAWPGGYLDHVGDTIQIAHGLWIFGRTLPTFPPVPFGLSTAALVLFVHDLEKPFKPIGGWRTKSERLLEKKRLIRNFGFDLSSDQWNAVEYCEGEGADYSSSKRVMGPLAAFCHVCDVMSARIWFDRRG